MLCRIVRLLGWCSRLPRTVYTRNVSYWAVRSNLIGIDNIFSPNNLLNNSVHLVPHLRPLSVHGDPSQEFSEAQFLYVCEETLQSLYERFEELAENHLARISDVDIVYEGGILKVDLGTHGTYVINRQTPNKQIWLSSPFSGPKRYDYVKETDEKGYWLYKHDGVTLHKLLESEISKIVSKDIGFGQCLYCK